MAWTDLDCLDLQVFLASGFFWGGSGLALPASFEGWLKENNWLRFPQLAMIQLDREVCLVCVFWCVPRSVGGQVKRALSGLTKKEQITKKNNQWRMKSKGGPVLPCFYGHSKHTIYSIHASLSNCIVTRDPQPSKSW